MLIVYIYIDWFYLCALLRYDRWLRTKPARLSHLGLIYGVSEQQQKFKIASKYGEAPLICRSASDASRGGWALKHHTLQYIGRA